jgi:hypothetical protein
VPRRSVRHLGVVEHLIAFTNLIARIFRRTALPAGVALGGAMSCACMVGSCAGLSRNWSHRRPKTNARHQKAQSRNRSFANPEDQSRAYARARCIIDMSRYGLHYAGVASRFTEWKGPAFCALWLLPEEYLLRVSKSHTADE